MNNHKADQLMNYWMIVNNPAIAAHIASRGVSRIFLDLEVLGKQARQGHLDTWMSAHQISDAPQIRSAIGSTELLIRLNPWHEGSPAEINAAIGAGGDLLMLPMFREIKEVESFCRAVDSRVPVVPLVETGEALKLLPQVAQVPGVSELFIGLNDLKISLGLSFLFEPLINGLLDRAADQLHGLGIPWGFGGLARFGEGMLPAEMILGEHMRLGSSSAILSRTFHRMAPSLEALQAEMDFSAEIAKLRAAESHWRSANFSALAANHAHVRGIIEGLVA
jgi:2-keto-3-deoxy-L-rhamnonate aldolase RhmA